MKLLRLKLENFRQHMSTEIDFSDGMTAIVGPNGTGKTTILEAITFALFGDCRGKIDDIRFYWVDRGRYYARLTFQLGERIYEVERGSATAHVKEITSGEKVWATGKAETTAKCESILGLTYEHFTNSFCAEQKALRFLQFKNNSERQAEVARMLGYDKLELAEALGNDRRRDFARQRGWMESALRDPAVLEAEKSLAQQRLTEAKARAEQSKAQKKEQEALVPVATEKATRATNWLNISQQMEVIAGNAQGLKSGLKLAEEALQEAEKEVLELKELTPIEAEYQTLCKKLEEAQKAYQQQLQREQLTKQLEQLGTEQELLAKQIADVAAPDLKPIEASLEQAIKAHAKAVSGCDAATKAWADQRVKVNQDLTEARTIATRAVADLKTAEEMVAKGVCPECGQPITASYEEILEARRKEVIKCREVVTTLEVRAASVESKPKELATAEEEVQKALATNNQAQAALTDARRKRDQADSLDNQQAGLKTKSDALRKQLEALPLPDKSLDIGALQAQKNALEPKHARYLAVQKAESKLAVTREKHVAAKKDHDEAREKYQELGKERQDLGFATKEEAEGAVDSLRLLKSLIERSEMEIKLATEQESSAKKELENATKALAEHKQKKKEIAELQEREVLHKATADELRNLRLFLNQELGPELEARASENVALLTNGRYSKITLDKNFAAALHDEGEISKPVISGGEEDVVALSLRLALSELIQERQGRPMSLLILDEVFGSLDVDRRQSVMDRLAALKTRFAQILVISHIEEINQVADQCLYLRRDEQTRSTIVTDAPPLNFAEL